MNRSKLFFTTLAQSFVGLVGFLLLLQGIEHLPAPITTKVQPILIVALLTALAGVSLKVFGYNKYGWSASIFLLTTSILSVYNGVDFFTTNGIIAIVVFSIAITLCVMAQNSYWVWGIIVPILLGIVIERVALITISLFGELSTLVIVGQ